MARWAEGVRGPVMLAKEMVGDGDAGRQPRGTSKPCRVNIRNGNG